MVEEREAQPLSGFRRAALIGLVVLLVASVAARALVGGEAGPAPAPTGGAAAPAQGFLPGGTGAPAGAEPAAEEPGPLERALPVLTEGSLFALIGFALGYTTKKVVKLLLILLALAFVAVQALVHFGGLEVDWGGVVAWINARILNLRENATVTEVLTDRIPSAGGLGVGYLLGFRRG